MVAKWMSFWTFWTEMPLNCNTQKLVKIKSWGYTSVVQCLPMCEAVGSISSTEKNKNGKLCYVCFAIILKSNLKKWTFIHGMSWWCKLRGCCTDSISDLTNIYHYLTASQSRSFSYISPQVLSISF